MRDMLYVMLGNIDSREQLITEYPHLKDVMIDRFWSTDDLEMYFSVHVGGEMRVQAGIGRCDRLLERGGHVQSASSGP